MVNEYHVIRSRRRSIGLTVTREAQLIIRAPIRTPAYEIERIVRQKSRWISQKQELSRQRLSLIPPPIAEPAKLALKQKALEFISLRVAHFAALAGLSYQSVKINTAKSRWGSCSRNGRLNFTWRLIMAPYSVIDYVVVHELMHLKEMNHSPKFWLEVGRILPDYKAHEQWLKNNALCLGY